MIVHKKEDVAFPRASTDDVLLTPTIESHEKSDVATFDILGEYLKN